QHQGEPILFGGVLATHDPTPEGLALLDPAAVGDGAVAQRHGTASGVDPVAVARQHEAVTDDRAAVLEHEAAVRAPGLTRTVVADRRAGEVDDGLGPDRPHTGGRVLGQLAAGDGDRSRQHPDALAVARDDRLADLDGCRPAAPDGDPVEDPEMLEPSMVTV